MRLALTIPLVAVALAVPAALAWRSDADAAPRAAAASVTPSPTYVIPTPTPRATPTPTPTPTATPPRSSLELLIVAVRPPRLRGRTLAWTVQCAPRACHATFTTRVLIRGRRHALRLPSLRHRRVPATKARRFALRLSSRQIAVVRAAWRRHRRVTADLRARATDSRGHHASFRLKKRLRPPSGFR